ncbi:unnamed protein product [Rotaria sp. Silwood2]|nr:unnamed protein product [Rotaria sp. Silwood2]
MASSSNKYTFRAFMALSFNGHGLKTLETLVRILRSLHGSDGLYWQTVYHYHVTLKFLGNIDTFLLKRITKQMKIWAHASAPFQLSLNTITGFPTPHKTRCIVATLNDSDVRLKRLVDQIAGYFAMFDFAIDGRPFIPHVTLARAFFADHFGKKTF